MTPQKAILDSKRTLSWFVSYRRLSPPFQLWPLLAVETEVNGYSKSTNERGPSLVAWLGLSCQYKRFLFCLGCSSRPNKKLFLLSPVTTSIVPITQQARQAVVPGRLSIGMCLMCLIYATERLRFYGP
jgi:hypothetical protein